MDRPSAFEAHQRHDDGADAARADGSTPGWDRVVQSLQQVGLAADTDRAPPLPSGHRLVDLLAWRLARAFWRVQRFLLGRQREFNILTLGCLDGLINHWQQREKTLLARIGALEDRLGKIEQSMERERSRSHSAAA
jgi:hypothetical protein